MQIIEVLSPLESCQFVITVASLAYSNPTLPRMVEELLKHQMEVWESPTFLLQDLIRYRRSMVRIRHSQICIVHVTFPPKWRTDHDLNFPVFWKGQYQSVNLKRDIVIAFMNAGKWDYFIHNFASCSYPVNTIILRHDGKTVDPMWSLRYSTHPDICGAQGGFLCIYGMAPSEGKSLISKPYDGLLEAFKEHGKDFHHKAIFTDLPNALKACPSVRCMDAIKRPTFVRDVNKGEFFLFLELAKRLNISGFFPMGTPVHQRLNCELGTIYPAILPAAESLNTFQFVLQRYECLKLVYGNSPIPPSPLKFQSLLEPFVPYVWPALLISYSSASIYVLLRLGSVQMGKASGFVFSAWFGNEQRVWLPKPRKDSSGKAYPQFNILATSVASVGFFLICSYCAYVQTHVVIPGTYKSSKTAAELLADGYDMFTHPVNCDIFHDIINNFVPEKNLCPPFADCQSAEYVQHVELGKVLQPVTGALSGDDNFWRLEKKAALLPDRSVSPMFGILGKRLGRDYFSAKDEYLNTPRWYIFARLPHSDVVIEVFQRIEQAGIAAWVRHWTNYWYYREVEGTSGPKTHVEAFAMTDTIIAESFLLFAFGMSVSLGGFLVVEVGVPTARRLFSVVRSCWSIAVVKTKAKIMSICN